MLADVDIAISRMLPDLAEGLRRTVRENCGEHIPFMLTIFSGQRGHYIATEERAVCLAALQQLVDHLESGKPKMLHESQVKPCTRSLMLLAKPLAQTLDDGLTYLMGKRLAFTLIFFTEFRPTYISTADRSGSLEEIKSLMREWELGVPDVPDHTRH